MVNGGKTVKSTNARFMYLIERRSSRIYPGTHGTGASRAARSLFLIRHAVR